MKKFLSLILIVILSVGSTVLVLNNKDKIKDHFDSKTSISQESEVDSNSSIASESSNV